MKHIIKSAEPVLFSSWKASNPGATYATLCSSNPSAIQAKRALKDSLIAEQKYLCCYCESRITRNTSHIEHFRPKDSHQFPLLQLQYDNLHASCHKDPLSSPDEHCGHKKGNVFSADLVSPLQPDCALHFSYGIDGTISGADLPGNTTVQILHLDSSLLNAKRKFLIDFFIGIEDDDDRKREIGIHLDDSGTQLQEFYTMIEYLDRRGLL